MKSDRAGILAYPFSVIQLSHWLNRPDKVYGRCFGKPSICVAWLGLLLAVVSPPHGTGVSVCFWRACTGLPCPGCGMTRSLSCAARGMFVESWNYHPMGALILALFAVTAATSLLPGQARQRLARHMEAHAVVYNGLYLAFVTAFVGFGVLRALLCAWGVDCPA